MNHIPFVVVCCSLVICWTVWRNGRTFGLHRGW
jgi:hypothetical protein